MTPEQARLLIAVLHRLNVPQDDITRTIIDDFAKSLGAYAAVKDAGIGAGAPVLGTPALTVHPA